jgi:hypothetical protein
MLKFHINIKIINNLIILNFIPLHTIKDFADEIYNLIKFEAENSSIKDEFKNKVIEYSSVLKDDLNRIISQKDSYKKDIDNLMEEGRKLKVLNEELETSKICVMCERILEEPDLIVISKKIESNKAEMSNIITKIKGIKPKYDELSESIDKYKNKDIPLSFSCIISIVNLSKFISVIRKYSFLLFISTSFITSFICLFIFNNTDIVFFNSSFSFIKSSFAFIMSSFSFTKLFSIFSKLLHSFK